MAATFDATGQDHAQELGDLMAKLTLQPDREQVASELGVLRSIYGEDAIRLWHLSATLGDNHHMDDGDCSGIIRYEVALYFPSPHEDVQIKVLVSLPPSYPALSPPQLQLLSKYVGAFAVDPGLFGSVLRTFISINGVEWTADMVCVFDGLQNILERCLNWYEVHLKEEKAVELLREESKELTNTGSDSSQLETQISKYPNPPPVLMPEGCEIVEAEAIIDRKSAFIGRACQVTHPAQVPVILSHLLCDRRISRAAHPLIYAWRCRIDTVLHQDNDDDGETAAGGRLAHLLQILDVENVLVIVTRYFGGTRLGPDRFKHINQAARNALELGGFLDGNNRKKNTGRGNKA